MNNYKKEFDKNVRVDVKREKLKRICVLLDIKANYMFHC